MKKIFSVAFALLFVSSFATAQLEENEAPISEGDSQEFFESAESEQAEYDAVFNVYNISKSNTDATSAGAHTGDILLYELELKGKSAGMHEGPEVNLASMIDFVNIENIQNGELIENSVIYPPISEGIDNWNRKYGLYVKVTATKDDTDSIRASFEGAYQTVSILDETEGCVSGQCDLAKSGPTQNWLFWGIIMGIIGLVGISFARS